MESLREQLLRQELQRKIERAKELESSGKHDEASAKFSEASAIYRRIAMISPREKAQEAFHAAGQYQDMSKTVKNGPKIRKMSESDPELFEQSISSLIVTQKPSVTWNDIGGLKNAKSVIKEAIILPFVKDKPPFVKSQRTILMYGPPGTGKTMLAKASSNTLEATFFEAKASGLLSKYYGESTKILSALFSKAREMQPSLIFIDELDSLATKRGADTNEASRRVLGEMLTQIEGFSSGDKDRVLVMAATNKPWDLDEAAISRFQRKIYVPLPDRLARKTIFSVHLNGARLSEPKLLKELADNTEGFSGRDIMGVCQEAISSMVREQNNELESLSSRQLDSYKLKTRELEMEDFRKALSKVRPSATGKDLERYEEWKKDFGG